MKIATVVGARPQFIKAASLSRELRKNNKEILIHTGQHYDQNMSKVFFDELDIPKPDYNLGVGSGTHAKQTAEMMIGIEDILLKEKPEILVLYGDTNSTVSAAITAAKLNIPIAHIEAGVRCYVKDMPEEQNRIVTDHLATWNFTPSQLGEACLKKEGLAETTYNVGDIMYDGILYYGEKVKAFDHQHFANRLIHLGEQKLKSDQWYLSTIHRPENTDDINRLKSILEALQQLKQSVILPAHPRIKKKLAELDAYNKYKNIVFVEPLSYLDTIYFAKNAVKIITDSGGLHKEAYLMGTPAVVILRNTGWEETLKGNCNVLAKPDREDILDKVNHTVIDDSCFGEKYYGDGKTAIKICKILGE